MRVYLLIKYHLFYSRNGEFTVKCERCGNVITENDRFCGKCGLNLINGNKGKKSKTKWIVLITCIFSVFIAGIVFIVFSTAPKSLKDKLEERWYYRNKSGSIEYLSFSNGIIKENPDIDHNLSDVTGKYTVNDNILTYKYNNNSTAHSLEYVELNDNDIERNLISIGSNQWYASEKYLVFEGKVYLSSDYFWN